MLGQAGGLVAGFLTWTYALLVPGLLWALALYPGRTLLFTLVTGLSIGLFAMPVGAFLFAWLTGTVVSVPLVLSLATLLSPLALVVRWPQAPSRGDSGDGGAVALTLALLLLMGVLYEGTALGYWDTYIVAPALFIIDEPIAFVDMNGNLLVNATLTGKLFDNLRDDATYGIITKDQRLGAGVLVSVHALLLGDVGFRLAFACYHALGVAAVYLAARLLFVTPWMGIAAATLLGFNGFVLTADTLNPNAIAMSMSAVMTMLMLHRPRGRQWVVIGMLLGTLGGVRNIALLFVPAVIWATRPWDRRHLVLLLATALILNAPFLAWNRYAFGSMFTHAAMYAGYGGWRPQFDHRLPLLGTSFKFNGMLNWPFYDEVVRTPHFPLPVFLLLPLTVIRSFGLVLSALGLAGIAFLWRGDRAATVLLLLWVLPYFVFFLPQENWSELKMTFLLPIYPALVLLVLAGVHGSRPLHIAVALLLLIVLVRVAATSEYPPDPRWPERFPHSVANAGRELPDGLRDTQFFFHLPENDEELARQRQRFTAGNVLPSIRTVPRERVSGLGAVLRDETGERNADGRRTMIAVWNYIYG